MTKEKFKEYVEKCGGVESFVESRELLMELVCAMDEFIELEAKVDMVEVSEEEITKKATKMVLLMSEVFE